MSAAEMAAVTAYYENGGVGETTLMASQAHAAGFEKVAIGTLDAIAILALAAEALTLRARFMPAPSNKPAAN